MVRNGFSTTMATTAPTPTRTAPPPTTVTKSG